MAEVISLQEPEQLLFSFDEEFYGDISTPVSKVKSIAVKPTAPQFLSTLRSSALSLEDFLSKVGANSIKFHDGWRNKVAKVSVNRVNVDEQANSTPISVSKSKENDGGDSSIYLSTLAYFDECGRLWKADLKLCFDQELTRFRYGSAPCRSAYCT